MKHNGDDEVCPHCGKVHGELDPAAFAEEVDATAHDLVSTLSKHGGQPGLVALFSLSISFARVLHRHVGPEELGEVTELAEAYSSKLDEALVVMVARRVAEKKGT